MAENEGTYRFETTAKDAIDGPDGFGLPSRGRVLLVRPPELARAVQEMLQVIV